MLRDIRSGVTSRIWSIWMLGLLAALGVAGISRPAAAQTPPLKLGILTDMSSLYADNGGQGSVVAAQLAVDDFGRAVLGRKIEVISADHQNKADIGSAITRRWIDNENVEVILDVPNSAVALAVQGITRQKKKLFLATGAATSRLTGDECSQTGIHWTYDTYALSQGATKAVSRLGVKNWYFLSADYSLGAQLEADSRKVITAEGGQVVGAVKHPINTSDFSSFLLQAQSSKADAVALADAGGDFINAVKQAGEFGVTKTQKLVGLLVFIADIHSLGLQSARGLILSSAFYWDLNDDTRAWSKRFIEKTNKVPTMIHAGNYGAVMHYLKSVSAAGTVDGPAVAAKMRETPVNDFMTRNGKIREDGRLVRDMYLFKVKSPEQSRYRFDYYELLATIPGNEAFKAQEEGGCPPQQKIAATALSAIRIPPRSSGRDGHAKVDQIMRGRFACRAFTARPVPQQTITDILDVARFAPSGANIQPWRVYVVSGAKKDEISCALLRAHEEARDQHTSEYQYYAPQLPEPYLSRRNQFGRLFYGSLDIQQSDTAGRARQTAKNYSFFGAPVGLIVTIDRRLEQGSWLDLGMFIQNVMIAAGARGLQTCPQETFSKYHALLRKLLPISREEMVVCGMSIGFAEADCLNKGSLMSKVAVEEFAQFIGFEG